MLNQCQFIGNLGADPEIKAFNNGGRVANLRLAVSESWKDKNTGERKEKTEWVSVSIFSEGLVGVAERFLHKGSRVFVSGKMQTRKWQDSDGKDRYSTEIVLQGYDAKLVMLDRKGEGGSSSEGGSSYGGETRQTAPKPAPDNWGDDIDDEIPF
jgi:single-strand DNA-binding protein